MRVMEVMGQTERSDTEDWKDKGEESVSEGLICLWRKEEFGRSSFFFSFYFFICHLPGCESYPEEMFCFSSCLARLSDALAVSCSRKLSRQTELTQTQTPPPLFMYT